MKKMGTHRWYFVVRIRTVDKSAHQKLIFLFLIQNICCGYGTQKNRLSETVLLSIPKTYEKTDG